MNTLKTYVAMLLTIILWASAYVGIREGIKAYTPCDLAFFRYAIASIAMAILYFSQKRRPLPARNDLIKIAILGIIGFSIYNIALNYGELTVQAGAASFITCTCPLFIVIFAISFLNERMSKLGWLGLMISVFGVFLVACSENATLHFNKGLIYILLSTMSMAIYTSFQKSLLKRVNVLDITTFAIWSGTAVMLVFLPHTVKQIIQAPLPITLSVIYLGIFPAAIAYFLWGKILSVFPASQVASLFYLIPVVAALLAWLTLGEKIAPLCLLGGVFVILGTVLVNMQRHRLPQHSEASVS